MTGAENPPRPGGRDRGKRAPAELPGRDGFSAPSYHQGGTSTGQPTTTGRTKPRLGTDRPVGTGDLTVTRAVVARSRYFSKLVAHKVIEASEADGAKESGLTAMIWNQVMSYGADAMITVALAGTVFFSASDDAQRGNVLLYLATTMAPFAIVAPVIGPALDRFQHGRRWVLAATAFGRAALAVVMAMNFNDLFVLFPAALGSLVLSKAYAVIRAAAAPRLVPSGMTLVEANARLSLFGLVAAVLGGSFVGFAVKLSGSYPLGLWITALAFVATAVFALRLPRIVDSPPKDDKRPDRTVASELARERLTGDAHRAFGDGDDIGKPSLARSLWRRLAAWSRRGYSPAVLLALQGETLMRWLSGFVTLFLAFYIETTSHGLSAVASLGALGGATGGGNFAGTALGTRLKLRRPEVVVILSTALTAVVCVLTALFFSISVAVVSVLVAGAANSLSKISLDAIIQRETAEALRSSAFSRSETFLQLGWVVGAAVALLLPSDNGQLGYAVASVVTVTGAMRLTLRRRGLPRRPAAKR